MTERDHRDDRPIAEVRFQAPVTPPVGDDFRIIWTADRRANKMEYSLVQVPLDEPVEIHYTKPELKLDFAMSPTEDPGKWTVRGEIDSDIVQLMGMPVENTRRGPTPPVVGAENIEALGKFGEVAVSDQGRLAVSLTISTENVSQLLDRLWRPKLARTEHRRLFSLEDNGAGYRILPEKAKNEVKGPKLVVRRPTPQASTGGAVYLK